MSETYDWLRLINGLMSSLVFCALVYKGRLFFGKYDPQQKALYLSFTLYTLTASYGSVEAYAQETPMGVRVYLLLLANSIAIYAFVRFRNSAFAIPHDDDRSVAKSG